MRKLVLIAFVPVLLAACGTSTRTVYVEPQPTRTVVVAPDRDKDVVVRDRDGHVVEEDIIH